MSLRLAAIASGTGSNVAAIQGHIEAGRLDARIVVILSNNPDAKVLEFGKSRGIPVWSTSHKGIEREAYDALLVEQAREHGADTIVLAGYMRLVTPVLLRAFPGRVLNVHPALLPSFPGVHGGADAINYGVRFSGITVHFVDEGVDTGPVIAQAITPVGQGDTEQSLMQRLHSFEHVLYAQALQWLAQGRLTIAGRRVLLAAPVGGQQKGTAVVMPGAQGQVLLQHELGTVGGNAAGPWVVSPPLDMPL